MYTVPLLCSLLHCSVHCYTALRTVRLICTLLDCFVHSYIDFDTVKLLHRFTVTLPHTLLNCYTMLCTDILVYCYTARCCVLIQYYNPRFISCSYTVYYYKSYIATLYIQCYHALGCNTCAVMLQFLAFLNFYVPALTVYALSNIFLVKMPCCTPLTVHLLWALMLDNEWVYELDDAVTHKFAHKLTNKLVQIHLDKYINFPNRPCTFSGANLFGYWFMIYLSLQIYSDIYSSIMYGNTHLLNLICPQKGSKMIHIDSKLKKKKNHITLL